MNFYICLKEININEKIIYKVDDIIIIENVKYLNLEDFKSYPSLNEIFYISSTFTLREIDLFLSIWKKYY